MHLALHLPMWPARRPAIRPATRPGPGPDWEIAGQDWPNRTASRFITSSGFAWHVQVLGRGPVLLLLYGTGAASHSFRDLAPLLAADFTAVVPDLPGHGFTEMPRGALSLPAMAGWTAQLMRDLALVPAFAAGHSAGAAIALRMALDHGMPSRGVIGINAAIAPFPGMAAWLFPALARLLMLNPLVAPVVARRARRPGAVARLLAGTGSRIDAKGVAWYARLLGYQRHAGAALAMMAGWELGGLQRDLHRLTPHLTLIASDGDRAVPPRVSAEAAARLPRARLIRLPALGHLAHEEDPAALAALIRTACTE